MWLSVLIKQNQQEMLPGKSKMQAEITVEKEICANKKFVDVYIVPTLMHQ